MVAEAALLVQTVTTKSDKSPEIVPICSTTHSTVAAINIVAVLEQENELVHASNDPQI
jgi:hypothetical protein